MRSTGIRSTRPHFRNWAVWASSATVKPVWDVSRRTKVASLIPRCAARSALSEPDSEIFRTIRVATRLFTG